MEITSIEKSQKISNRIQTIKANIRAHRRNIKSLNEFMKRHFPITQDVFLRIVKFSCIPFSEERFHWTLKNLTDQIRDLEYELAILLKYGV